MPSPLLPLILLLPHGAAAVNKAVARIRGATAANPVSGWVVFEQDESDPLADVTVRVNVSGLSVGEHGFHVHQFGDSRVTKNLSTFGAHFVPFCIPPDVPINGSATADDCQKDATHGLPPSEWRQPGDMGNVLVTGTAPVVLTLVLGQQKMSLTDPLRSIVGRTVVFHSLRDDGSQPYGNAGDPEAYGMIGMKRPDDGATNSALAPTVPKVDKVICTFQGAYPGVPLTGPDVRGSAILQLMEPERPGIVRMRARLEGLSKGNTHSFHFHTWGDMTVAFTDLGSIYSANSIYVDSISVNSPTGVAFYQAEYSADSLLQHVGRSLTIHAGGDSSSPTISAAVCGLANPRATLDLTGSPFAEGDEAPMSGGVLLLVVVTVIVVSAFLGTAVLYFMRVPIPFCGRCLYDDMIALSPPPPPPQGHYADQGKYGSAQRA